MLLHGMPSPWPQQVLNPTCQTQVYSCCLVAGGQTKNFLNKHVVFSLCLGPYRACSGLTHYTHCSTDLDVLHRACWPTLHSQDSTQSLLGLKTVILFHYF